MKLKFFLLIIGVYCLFNIPLNAQSDKQAKIVLKNGVKVKGGIVQSLEGDKLRVNINGSEEVTIRYDLIKKIVFRGYGRIDDNYEEKLRRKPSLKTKSFFHEIRGGLLFGEENVSVSLQTINGYQFNKYLGAGLGLGINKYGNHGTVPIYATAKGYLFNKSISPFYFGDLGYGFAWKTDKNDDIFELDNVEGGLYWQLGLGYQFNFYKSSVVVTLGYINQDSKADYIYFRPWDVDDVEVTERRILRRIAFSVGFLF